ncbi:hypothetical protein M9H77_33772 [Catharanthus roseus]|uniref:Uncharacterized protein n=1 Tax=Catharanthus roseus TaxID=4058 RepID=A0ACB9ZJD7_CATRO|nr:hypothetical protein M9H77_33772 [Catharanthus roseus]
MQTLKGLQLGWVQNRLTYTLIEKYGPKTSGYKIYGPRPDPLGSRIGSKPRPDPLRSRVGFGYYGISAGVASTSYMGGEASVQARREAWDIQGDVVDIQGEEEEGD